MKAVMDDVAKQSIPSTGQVLEEAYLRNLTAVEEKLQRSKHLYIEPWRNEQNEKQSR